MYFSLEAPLPQPGCPALEAGTGLGAEPVAKLLAGAGPGGATGAPPALGSAGPVPGRAGGGRWVLRGPP